MNEIVKDSRFELAERYVNGTGVSVFLTGKAGTGKTTFLKYIRETTTKRSVVLAPTGVAAINAGGVTIHSFFQLPLCPYLPEVKELLTEYQMPERYFRLNKERLSIIRTLDLLIIDEVSMVRADLLDAVDMCLRRFRHSSLPFGGVQLLLIGDARQLSPVVTEKERPYIRQVYSSPYFFESKALKKVNYVTVELETIHRQKDSCFIGLLNRIRSGIPDSKTLETLNSRYIPDFNPPQDEKWIRLTTHNAQSDKVNNQKLDELPGNSVTYIATVEGDFPPSSYPVPENLTLKVGEQVMFTRNDSSGAGRWYNGRIGTVKSLDGAVTVESEGEILTVEQENWNNIKYVLNSESGEIEQSIEGTFTQIPLRPAWAVTIHKSQGLTFDRVIIDAAQAFAAGQVYVAFSRCRTLDGIVLSSRIYRSSIHSDDDVTRFNNCFASEEFLTNSLPTFESEYRCRKMQECFDFDQLSFRIAGMRKLFADNLLKVYPEKVQVASECYGKIRELCDVGKRFAVQIGQLSRDEARLNGRAVKAAEYFLPVIESLRKDLLPLTKVSVDNKEIKRQIHDIGKEMKSEFDIKILTLSKIVTNGFSVEKYLQAKTDAMLGKVDIAESGKAATQKSDKQDAPEYHDIYKENRHPELVENLINWRWEKCKEMNVPAYFILHQKTLLAIADSAPKTEDELLAVDGFGKAKLEKFGNEILGIIREAASSASARQSAEDNSEG